MGFLLLGEGDLEYERDLERRGYGGGVNERDLERGGNGALLAIFFLLSFSLISRSNSFNVSISLYWY